MRFLLGILLFLPLLSVSQKNVDSLRTVWCDLSNQDSIRLNAFTELIWDGYLFSQPDSAFFLAEKGIEFAKSKDFKKEMAILLNVQGVSLMLKGDYIRALQYHKKGLKVNEDINDKQGISNSLNNIGTILTKLGDYAGAIETYGRSLKLSEELNDSSGIARCYLNIGIIYRNIEKYDIALEYYQKCLQICEDIGNYEGVSKCYNNLGIIYSHYKNYDQALEYYFRTLSLNQKLKNYLGVGNALGNIGVVYMLKGDLDSSMVYQKRSLNIHKKVGSKEGEIGCLNNIGEIFNSIRIYDSTIVYGSKAFKLAQEIGSLKHIAATANVLYKAYKSLNQNSKALSMFELYVVAKDSLQRVENHNEIINQEYKYKYEKQHILDSLKNAQTLALEKMERQKEVEKARLQKYILFFLFVFSLVIVAIVIRFRSIKVRAEKSVLLKEIQMLKSVAVVNLTSGNEIPYNKHLNREKISTAINGVLNDSDWSILSLLCESPTISNREISEKISLSFEGVRSSLKKMYRIFDIQNSVENQRIALVIKAIRISNT